MTVQPMIITFIVLFAVLILFIQSKLRPDLIAVGALLLLTIFDVLTPEEALAGFSNTTVIMLASLFIVGAGVFDAGLAGRVGNSLLRFRGNNEKTLMIVIMLTVSLFSAFLSSLGTVALLLPVIISIAFKLNIHPSRFLLPLAFASSLGGVLTVIGSPAILIISDALKKAGYERLAFFDITGIGLVALGAGIVFMLTFGRKLLPSGENNHSTGDTLSAGELAGLYKVYDRLHFVHVPDSSDIIGERLADLKLPTKFEITVIEMERKIPQEDGGGDQIESLIASADQIIYPQDLLLVFGGEEEVAYFVNTYNLERKPFELEDIKSHFLSETYGMTEILISPNSILENQTIVDVHLREKYTCSCLAINRKGEYLQRDLSNEKLQQGDALLVHGKWENIELLSKDLYDVVVLGTNTEEESIPHSDGKAPVAGIILFLMLMGMITEVVPPIISAISAAFLMVVTGCIRSIEEAYQRINLDVVILIAALLPVSAALEKTGGVQIISNYLLDLLGKSGPYALLAGLYLIAAVLSQFIGSPATAVFLAPIAITSASGMGVSAYPFIICVAVASSMAFATPAATPANAMVMTAGGYNFNDFLRVGIPMKLFVGIFVVLALPVFFPF